MTSPTQGIRSIAGKRAKKGGAVAPPSASPATRAQLALRPGPIVPVVAGRCRVTIPVELAGPHAGLGEAAGLGYAAIDLNIGAGGGAAVPVEEPAETAFVRAIFRGVLAIRAAVRAVAIGV